MMKRNRYSLRKQAQIKRNKYLNGLEVGKQFIDKKFVHSLIKCLENELEIAICNQIYFHRNPSEIFGDAFDCSPAHLRTVLHSMLPNVDLFDDNQHQSANRY